MMSELQIPENLLYTRDHEWIKVDGDEAWVGITAFAAQELGDIVYLDIPEPGRTYARDEVFGTVEAVKTVSDLLMPADGVLLESNPLLTGSPELINGDPYWDGWIIKVQLSKPLNPEELLTPLAYRELIAW